MSPRIECEISESVWLGLTKRRHQMGGPLDPVVDSLLAEALALDRHSLFQVSTSNALVQGVFGGIITVGQLRGHGDFGLGTFTGLDGEMIMLEGECFRATANGAITTAEDDRDVPFAIVTRFATDRTDVIEPGSTLSELARSLDALRPSENLFVAIRVDGGFGDLWMRAACPARRGESLVEATRHQSEFGAPDMRGTLVGFWSPEYSRSVSVPGYHFHFISEDRTLGGHVLDLRTGEGQVRLHTETDLHVALPETAEFLTADLRGDHQADLIQAESDRRSR